MALLFADGCEDGTGAWTVNNGAVGTGRYGLGFVTSATSGRFQTAFTPTAGPVVAGFAFKPAGTGAFCVWMGSVGSNAHVILAVGASGEVAAWRTSSANVLGTSATGVLPTGAWLYVESKVTIHDTTGSVVVRVNGVGVLNLTNVDTKDSTVTTTSVLMLGGPTSILTATGNAYDDVYIANTSGTYNTDFLGDLTVEHLRPASDDTAQWVGSDGNSTNNYDLVDEAGTANTADYVASSTIGQRDLYVPTASSRPISSPVLGVVVTAVAMKTDAGTRTAKLCVKEGSGGTVRQSADLGLTTSFAEIRAVFERKGDGGQFTVSDVNALRMGVEVST